MTENVSANLDNPPGPTGQTDCLPCKLVCWNFQEREEIQSCSISASTPLPKDIVPARQDGDGDHGDGVGDGDHGGDHDGGEDDGDHDDRIPARQDDCVRRTIPPL